jgi:hypothetical protein
MTHAARSSVRHNNKIMRGDVSKQDIDQIEREVFPDIWRRLLQGFKENLEKRHYKKIEIGSFEDESLHTIIGEEFDVILHNVDGIPVEDICNIASTHPCYVLSYMDEGLLRLRYTWVEPKVAKVRRRVTPGTPRASFWTTRRVLVLILLVALLTAFRAKLWSLVTSRWQ